MPVVKKQSTKKRKRKSKSVLDRIGPIGFESDGIKLNLYGKSGTGKTTLWATFPGPILAIIASGGSKPGELRSVNTKEYRRKIKQVVLQSSSEVGELCEHQTESEPFKTVVLDHATGLQDLVLKEILGLEEMPPQSSWGLASREEYGQCALQMKERLRQLLNLNCNVVIIAQEREFNVDNDSELVMPYVASALTPSIVGWLNPACDYVCQTFIREEEQIKTKTIGKGTKQKTIETRRKTGKIEYCLRTAPDPVYTTKFRLPRGQKLPDVIVDPNFNKINKLIKGGE